MNIRNDYHTHVKIESDTSYAEDRIQYSKPWPHSSDTYWEAQAFPEYHGFGFNDYPRHQQFNFTLDAQNASGPSHDASKSPQLSSSLPSSSSVSDYTQYTPHIFPESHVNAGGRPNALSLTHSNHGNWQSMPGTINPHSLHFQQTYAASLGLSTPTGNIQGLYSSIPTCAPAFERFRTSNQHIHSDAQVGLEDWPQQAADVDDDLSQSPSATDSSGYDDEDNRDDDGDGDVDDDSPIGGVGVVEEDEDENGSSSEASDFGDSDTDNESDYAEESNPQRTRSNVNRTNMKHRSSGCDDASSNSTVDRIKTEDQQENPEMRLSDSISLASEIDQESLASSAPYHTTGSLQSQKSQQSHRSKKQVVPRSAGGRYSANFFGGTMAKTDLYESTGQSVLSKIHVTASTGFEIRWVEDEQSHIFYRRNNLSLKCSIRTTLPSKESDQKLYLKKTAKGVSEPVDHLYLRLVTRIGDENGEAEEMKIFSSERKRLGAPSNQRIKPQMDRGVLVYPLSTGHGREDPDTVSEWHPMRIQFGRATHCNNSKQKNQEHFVLAVELMARKVNGSAKDDVIVGVCMWERIQVRGRAPSHFRDEPAHWEKLWKARNGKSEGSYNHEEVSDDADGTNEDADDEEDAQADLENDGDDGQDVGPTKRRRLGQQKIQQIKVKASKAKKESRLTKSRPEDLSREASIAKDFCAFVQRLATSSGAPWSYRAAWLQLKPGYYLPTKQLEKLSVLVKKDMVKDKRDDKADYKVLKIAVDFVKAALSRGEPIEPRTQEELSPEDISPPTLASSGNGRGSKRRRQS